MTKKVKRILWGLYYTTFGAIAVVSSIAVAQIYIIKIKYGEISENMIKFFSENGFTQEEILGAVGNQEQGSFLIIPEYAPYLLKIFSIILLLALMFIMTPMLIKFIKEKKREGRIINEE